MEFPISVKFLHCSAAVFDFYFPSTSEISFRLSNKFDQVIVLLGSCCPAIREIQFIYLFMKYNYFWSGLVLEKARHL